MVMRVPSGAADVRGAIAGEKEWGGMKKTDCSQCVSE